jgi:hypothetical protein
MDGGVLVSVTPEGAQGFPTEDGKEVVSRQDDSVKFYPIDGGQPRSAPAKIPDLTLACSGQSGRYVIGADRPAVPLKLYRYDTVTGERKPWRDLVPADRAGVYVANIFDITPDARWYLYSYCATSQTSISQTDCGSACVPPAVPRASCAAHGLSLSD